MKTRLMVPALLGLVLYGLLTYAASTIDLSGQWEMVLPDGRVYARLNLNQNGDRVSGTVCYDKGSAKVDGRISGSEAILSIIYDNADVLTEWYPRKVAEQVVGLTAIWKLALKPGATAYSGPFQGMGLEWNSSERVTSRLDARTPGVEQRYPPTQRTLRRIGAGPETVPALPVLDTSTIPTALPPSQAETVVLKPGQIWAAAVTGRSSLELWARIPVNKTAGAAYILEVQVNCRSVASPLRNKGARFKLADGRSFDYLDANQKSWALFHSPDYAANNSPAGGGYQVLSDPGQAYRYVWDVSALTGGAAQMVVTLRHSGQSLGQSLSLPIEVKISR